MHTFIVHSIYIFD